MKPGSRGPGCRATGGGLEELEGRDTKAHRTRKSRSDKPQEVWVARATVICDNSFRPSSTFGSSRHSSSPPRVQRPGAPAEPACQHISSNLRIACRPALSTPGILGRSASMHIIILWGRTTPYEVLYCVACMHKISTSSSTCWAAGCCEFFALEERRLIVHSPSD